MEELEAFQRPGEIKNNAPYMLADELHASREPAMGVKRQENRAIVLHF